MKKKNKTKNKDVKAVVVTLDAKNTKNIYTQYKNYINIKEDSILLGSKVFFYSKKLDGVIGHAIIDCVSPSKWIFKDIDLYSSPVSFSECHFYEKFIDESIDAPVFKFVLNPPKTFCYIELCDDKEKGEDD